MGKEEIRFHNLRGYDQRYNKILVFIIMNKRSTKIHRTKKHSNHYCNHYCNQTIIIIIVIVTVLLHYSRSFAQVIVPQWGLNFECARTDIKQSRFIIIRKCDITKWGPAKMTKNLKKCKHEKQILRTMIWTKDLSLERLCSRSIFYVSCNKAFFAFCCHNFFLSG